MKDFLVVGLLKKPSEAKKTKDTLAKELESIGDTQVHLLSPEEFSTVKEICTVQGREAEPQKEESKLTGPCIC